MGGRMAMENSGRCKRCGNVIHFVGDKWYHARVYDGPAHEPEPISGEASPTPVHMPPRVATTGAHKPKEEVITQCLPEIDEAESAGQGVASEPLQPVVARAGGASTGDQPPCSVIILS